MLPLVVTPGDPAGIGPEVTAKALQDFDEGVLVVGEAAALQRWAPHLEVLEPAPGEPVEVASIRLGVELCLRGEAAALVTGPIHKARLAARGFHHAGHTGFLGELTGAQPVMAFVGGSLRVCLVTVHLPLSEVPGAITPEILDHTFWTAHQELKLRLRLDAPRLLVCGLNPHAGDSGLLGHEERTLIGPACERARSRGLDVRGPVSAELAFRMARDGQADMVVAMYHDQGLAPLKLVDFGRSVNWTMGLPILRTSVDHGTADDIAGQDVADPSSMLAALKLARLLIATPSSRAGPSG